MWDFLLRMNVVDGPFIITVYALAAAVFIYLLGRGPWWGWILTVIVVLIVGAIVGAGVLWWAVNVLDVFGGPVTRPPGGGCPPRSPGSPSPSGTSGTRAGGESSSPCSRSRCSRSPRSSASTPRTAWTRRSDRSSASRPRAPSTSTSPTPPRAPIPPSPCTRPGRRRPTCPRSAPSARRAAVPNTNSDFPARPAQLYLPPAALVDDAPRLPLVIMMMGQPGDPDASFIGQVLDEYAARNGGLAPIVLVVDQLGDPTEDPLCLDTDLGKAETYIMQDVVPWAKQYLDVLQGRQFTTVAGYSNGGGCAAYFGAKYPEVFGNILVRLARRVRGRGAERRGARRRLQRRPGGVRRREARQHHGVEGAVPRHDGRLHRGRERPDVRSGRAAAGGCRAAAGMVTTFFIVPGADHGVSGLLGGLDKGFEVLYPRLGLSAP